MKMFGNMTTDGLEKVGDRLGGNGPLDTDFYTGTVKLAYAGKSSGGANSITVLIDLGDREYRETFYVTNKNGEIFYTDKKDPKKKIPLPGYTSVDDLCLLTTGQPLSEQDFEEKVVSIYDFEQKKDIPTNVPVLVGALGKQISAGILRQTVDKTAVGQDGQRRNTGETRDENVVDKFFHAETGKTVTEFIEQIQTPVFRDKWIEANKGKTRNRAKGAEGNTGMPGQKQTNSGMFGGASGGTGGGQTAKKSLFGN